MPVDASFSDVMVAIRTLVVIFALSFGFAVGMYQGKPHGKPQLTGMDGGSNSPRARRAVSSTTSSMQVDTPRQEAQRPEASSFENKDDDGSHEAASSSAAAPSHEPNIAIRLPGAEQSFMDSTGTPRDGLTPLVSISARFNGVSLERVQPDQYRLRPNGPTPWALVAKTQNGWHKVWQAHLAGVEKIADAELQKKIFLNWAEPVVDIVLVVVLFNPVNTNLDQRKSETVKAFWERVGEAGAAGVVMETLKRRTVFLDLVPVLDDGSGSDALSESVNEAARRNTYGDYFLERITGYVNMPRKGKLEVIFAPGTGGQDDKRNKKGAAGPAYGVLRGMAEVELTPVTNHPLRTKHDPQAREEYVKQLRPVVTRLSKQL